MNKREILIILNRLRDVSESQDSSSKITLNQLESEILLKYLIELKKYHERDAKLINDIVTLIRKNVED